MSSSKVNSGFHGYQRVTGSKIDPAPYVRYLQSKFGVIYGLE